MRVSAEIAARTRWHLSPTSPPLVVHSSTTPVAGTVNKARLPARLVRPLCWAVSSSHFPNQRPKLLPPSPLRPSQIKNPSFPAPQPPSRPRADHFAQRGGSTSSTPFQKHPAVVSGSFAAPLSAVGHGRPPQSASSTGGFAGSPRERSQAVHSQRKALCRNFGNSRNGIAPEHGFQLFGPTVFGLIPLMCPIIVQSVARFEVVT